MKTLLLIFIGGLVGAGVALKFNQPRLDPLSPELEKETSYGKELFVHTSRYLGLKGSIEKNMASRMNCQNCHLDAGQKPYGISIVSTHARYPEYRGRSGKILTLTDRINNCIERPMNGKALAPDSREMKALLAYFFSLSRGLPVGATGKGGDMREVIQFPKRAADVSQGGKIYEKHCVECHGKDGQGKLDPEQVEYLIPPLWGPESYNEASNMHRNSKAASFIRANMPLGATAQAPVLTNEEAFDVAAFINDPTLHPRPKSRWSDYPNIEQKPIDYPMGPYADGFSEEKHRLGPFLEIIEHLRAQNKTVYY